MDFAKKQLEKFGWKEGTGLGKNEQGMLAAIKPTLKVGKEGMGYDFSKELVDTWWTRAYDDSLKRINVDVDSSTNETVGVVLQDDEDDNNDSGSLVKDSSSERPFQKMRKRMMKATFTTFSKGATLSNGELIAEDKASDSDHSADDEDSKPNEVKSLTDEELFKACGGRTAHKAARFGLKLNGKLARIEAQEKANKSFLSKYISFKTSTKKDDEPPITEPEDDLSKRDLKKKKKKSKKDKAEDISADNEVGPSITSPPLPANLSINKDDDETASTTDSEGRRKKKKSSKKRKYEVIEVEAVDSIANKNDDANEEDTISEDLSSIKKHTKKSKKHKKSKYYKDDDESCALLS